MKAYFSRKGIGIKTNEDKLHTYHAYVTKEEKNNSSITIDRIDNQYFYTEKNTIESVCTLMLSALICLLMEILFDKNIFHFIQTFISSVPVIYITLSYISVKKSDKARLGAVNCFNNAYKSTGIIPTLDEIKKYSCYKKKDVVAIMLWICISIIILELMLFFLSSLSYACIILMGVFAIVSILLIIFTNLSFIQRIYTKKPSDTDLSMIVDVANKVKESVSINQYANIKGYVNN